MQKMLIVLFLALVIGICVVGVSQLDDTADKKVDEPNRNPATELIQ